MLAADLHEVGGWRPQVTYTARWQPDCIVGRIPNRGADTSTTYVGVYWSVEVLAWAKDDCAMSWRRSGATGVAPWRGPCGDPSQITLQAHELIQLDVGDETPPQPFTFPPGL